MFPIYFTVNILGQLECVGNTPPGDNPHTKIVLDFHRALKIWRRLRQFMKLSTPYSNYEYGWFAYLDSDGRLMLLDEFNDRKMAESVLQVTEPHAVTLFDRPDMVNWESIFSAHFKHEYRQWCRKEKKKPLSQFHPDVRIMY